MKALVVGAGSIGRRHLGNLRQLEPSAHITVWHQHTKPGDADANPPQADRVVYSFDNETPDVAFVCSPAARHIETALKLAQHGAHLFIEKPLGHTMDGVAELIELCRARDLTLMVGYNFHFYRPLQLMRQAIVDGRVGRVMSVRAEAGGYLPDWRPDRDYRTVVSAQRALGGGVVLELSHELDYVRWLVGEVKSVSAQLGKLSDLDLDVEDTAEITLQFANGALGHVHLNMTQRDDARTCRVLGTEGTLTWDATTHEVKLFSAATGEWSELHPATTIDRNEMYCAELQHFLGCVGRHEPPAVTGADGRRVLEIALAAKQSAQEQRVIKL